MASSFQGLNEINIKEEAELAFQEYRLQALLSKQIDLRYGIVDIMTMITIIISLGAMVISLATSSSYNIAFFILLVCLIYGFYGLWKQNNDKKLLQNQITQAMSAIHTYKKHKEEILKLQDNKEITGNKV
jgi:hypothetical protein